MSKQIHMHNIFTCVYCCFVITGKISQQTVLGRFVSRYVTRDNNWLVVSNYRRDLLHSIKTCV